MSDTTNWPRYTIWRDCVYEYTSDRTFRALSVAGVWTGETHLECEGSVWLSFAKMGEREIPASVAKELIEARTGRPYASPAPATQVSELDKAIELKNLRQAYALLRDLFECALPYAPEDNERFREWQRLDRKVRGA